MSRPSRGESFEYRRGVMKHVQHFNQVTAASRCYKLRFDFNFKQFLGFQLITTPRMSPQHSSKILIWRAVLRLVCSVKRSGGWWSTCNISTKYRCRPSRAWVWLGIRYSILGCTLFIICRPIYFSFHNAIKENGVFYRAATVDFWQARPPACHRRVLFCKIQNLTSRGGHASFDGILINYWEDKIFFSKNKMEGTPFLKLAMDKRLLVKTFVKIH